MLRGSKSVNLDAKGRVMIPARYRTELIGELSEQIVVTIDTQSPCLLMYPWAEWEVIEQKIAALPTFNPAARKIQRLFIGHAVELEVDTNGRVLLPALLREYAKLEKEMILVGQGNKLELWASEQWQQSRSVWLETMDLSMTDLSEELKGL